MRWQDHVTRLVVGPLQTNCYIILPRSGSDTVVIDPGGEGNRVREELGKRGLTLKLVILTHGHIDHVYGLDALLTGEWSGVRVMMNTEDRPLLEQMELQAGFMGFPPPRLDTEIEDVAHRDRISIGGRELEALHTPGHSPGSMSFALHEQRILFSGDTLFAGGVGRTDLWGGSWKVLRRSIETTLLTLHPETVVLPGHDEPTTIGNAAMWLRETALYDDASGGFE